jgi:RHS repeat-associated protein
MDGHSGVRGLTNSSGSLTDSYAYGAFGDLKNSSGTTANNYRYTGQQFDNLTGLYSLRARYYNPSEGRFNSRDTYPVDFNNPIELNRYGYTAGNPVNGSDPSGNDGLYNYGQKIQSVVLKGARILRWVPKTATLRWVYYGVTFAIRANFFLDTLKELRGRTNATIAVSAIEVAPGVRKWYAATNYRLNQDEIDQIRDIVQTQDTVLLPRVEGQHAEITLYRFAEGVAKQRGLEVEDVLESIGVSQAPCGAESENCEKFFEDLEKIEKRGIVVYYLGRKPRGV